MVLNKRDEVQKRTQQYAKYTSLGLNIGVAMMGLPWLGSFVDKRRGGGLTFSLLGLVFGLIYMGYQIWLVVRSTNEDSKEKKT